MRDSRWRPSASLDALRQRARLYRHIRDFFATRDVLEVVTPALAAHGVSEPAIDTIEVPGYGVLQSSPEYHMKRLLASGSGAIFQISQVFRHGEQGARHNPEFALLEWYQPGYSLAQLVEECSELLSPILNHGQVVHFTFREAFRQHTGVDPLSASVADLRNAIPQDQEVPSLDRAQLVDWLMACVVEPALPASELVAITEFPPWSAALAQLGSDAQGETVAQRFELYFNGLELANGYQELCDAGEQSARFAADRQRRQQLGLKDVPEDENLLAALQHGMPACAGVALGLDRVLMAALGSQRIEDVLAFPADRA